MSAVIEEKEEEEQRTLLRKAQFIESSFSPPVRGSFSLSLGSNASRLHLSQLHILLISL